MCLGLYNDALSCFPKKLNSPTLSVNSEGFIPMLAKLDDCIAYISSHVSNSVLILVKSPSCVHTLLMVFFLQKVFSAKYRKKLRMVLYKLRKFLLNILIILLNFYKIQLLVCTS